MALLHLIDVELPIPSQFNTINNDIPNPIEPNDIAKMLGHMDKDNNYIEEVPPYCETP